MRPVDPRLLREAPSIRSFLVLALGLAALSAAATIAWATLIGNVVSGVFLERKDLGQVSSALVVLAAIAFVRALVGWLFETSGHGASRRTRAFLRRRMLESLVAARPAGLQDLRAGELATSATSGLDDLDPYFARFLPQLTLAVVVAPAICIWVAFHDLESALVMAITLPLIPVFGALIGRAASERTNRRLRALSLMSAHFLDVVSGLATLRAYRRGKAQVESIARTTDAFRRETMGTLKVAFLSALVLELAAMISIALIAVSIGLRLVSGDIEFATAFGVLVLAPELYLPLRGVAVQFHASTDGLAAAQRAFELIDLPPAVSVPARPLAPPDLHSAALCFEQVGFSYEGRATPVVSRFSFELRPGERLVLSGESGAGKTTLLALALRFCDPTRGRILAGGVDLRELDPDAWREQIAWLPQRSHLIAGTVATALRVAAPDADEPLLWAALEAAGAADLVRALPGGLETVVGEGGTTFSAGEVRRLALARALVRRAPLLLLDEPTAHLDAATAASIRNSLGAIGGAHTILVATHDPELVAMATRVVRLPDGQTVEKDDR